MLIFSVAFAIYIIIGRWSNVFSKIADSPLYFTALGWHITHTPRKTQKSLVNTKS